MAVVDYSTFIAGHPEFATLDQSVVESRLADAEIDCPVDLWGSRQARAITLLTCHRLVMSQRAFNGLAVGGLTSLSASQGSQNAGFSQAGTKPDDPENLLATNCGAEFYGLRSRLPITGFTI